MNAALPLIWENQVCYADAWDFLRKSIARSSNLNSQSLHSLLKNFGQVSMENINADSQQDSAVFNLKQRFSPESVVKTGPEYNVWVHSLSIHSSSAQWAAGDSKLTKFRPVIQSCVNLCCLQLNFPVINDNDLWMIGKSCSSLRKLAFVSGITSHSRITDEGLVAIASNCKSLNELYLASRWIDANIPDELSGRSYLKSVFTSRGINALTQAFKGKLLGYGMKYEGAATLGASKQRSIQEFYGISQGSEQNNPIFHRSIQELFMNNVGIKTLEIDWPGILELVSEIVIGRMHSIKELMLGNIYSVEVVKKIIANCPLLQRLHLNDVHVTIDPRDFLCAFNRLLDEELLFSGQCTASPLNVLCMDGIGYTKEVWKSIASFTHLTKLQIRPSNRAASIRHASDDSTLAKALESLPFLEFLETVIMTDAPLNVLASTCPRLEYLDLIDGKMCTDQGLIMLSRGCPRITCLFLGTAELVSDVSIVELASSLHCLKRLSLPLDNKSISVNSLQSLCEDSKRLEGLGNLPESIIFQDLITHVANLPRLLVLSRCCSVTNAFRSTFLNAQQVLQLKKSCKSLQNITQIHI